MNALETLADYREAEQAAFRKQNKALRRTMILKLYAAEEFAEFFDDNRNMFCEIVNLLLERENAPTHP